MNNQLPKIKAMTGFRDLWQLCFEEATYLDMKAIAIAEAKRKKAERRRRLKELSSGVRKR